MRHTSSFFGQYPFSVDQFSFTMEGLPSMIDDAIGYACVTQLCAPGVEVVVVRPAPLFCAP